ncbi:MAG: thermonuclease family protein [Planctomycetota bacterium]
MTRASESRAGRTAAWSGPGILLLLALIAGALLLPRSPARRDAPPAPPAVAPTDSTPAEVLRVVDGDTLVLKDRTRVRLIGIDAPESVKPNYPVEPWGPEAAEFTRQFLATGPVRLSFDGDRTDQYGRTLAYVWVGEQMLNEELLRAGLARYVPQYRYSAAMKHAFAAAETEARTARRGIWSQSPAASRGAQNPSPQPATSLPAAP